MDPLQLIETKLLSYNQPMHAATEFGDSEVQKFYDSTTVFVTGGTGFLGKQLIEKLLRATKVSKIFILLRSKKGKLIRERIMEMLQDPVYDYMRDRQPGFERKLVPIAGDMAELRLGICDSDWKTVAEETDIIFHLAATTRFDEVLRVATLINVRGTREILALGTECRKLKSFVHVSTAYSNATHDKTNNDILEEFYKSPVNHEALIGIVETVEETRLNDMKPNFIKGWPNTYSFTKAVAEELILMKGKHLPICILRPAIVICSYREPAPGWLDISCVYGATGLLLGGALGAIHVAYTNIDMKSGLIPVDYVNNAAIVAGWDTAKRREADLDNKEVKIYNIVSSNRNPITWGTMHDLISSAGSNYPLPDAVWWVFSVLTSNYFLFLIYDFIFHSIPAHIIDIMLFILRKKTFAVKLSKKFTRLMNALSYFTSQEWNFLDSNAVELYGKLSAIDKEIFEFDPIKIEWNRFMFVWGMGIRKYIVKDGLTRSDYGHKKQTMFRLLSLFLIGPLYSYMFYKLFYILFASIWSVKYLFLSSS